MNTNRTKTDKNHIKNAFALLIGVGEDLPQTVKDVDAIAELLVDESIGAYNPKNIIPLKDGEANSQKVLEKLDELIEKFNSLKEEDSSIIIYFSGHGTFFYEEDGITGKYDRKYYLKTHGFEESQKDETGILGEVFSERLRTIKAKRKLILLDCCHASGVIDKSPGLSSVKAKSFALENKPSNEGLLKILGSGKGMVTIASCGKDEESVIDPEFGENSLFTKKILECLKGGYGYSNSKYITVIELILYVLVEVPKVWPTQNPQLRWASEIDRNFVLCRAKKPKVEEEELIVTGTEWSSTSEFKEDIAKLVGVNKLDTVIRYLRDYSQDIGSQELQKQIDVISSNYYSAQRNSWKSDTRNSVMEKQSDVTANEVKRILDNLNVYGVQN